MMNSVNLTGRLTKDPELRFTPDGVAVATITLAVNRTWKNASGERDADFPQIVAFKQTAQTMADYLKKGSLIAVEGRIQTRSYENNDQKMVYVTEVIAERFHFLESNGDNQQQNNRGNNNRNQNNRGNRR